MMEDNDDFEDWSHPTTSRIYTLKQEGRSLTVIAWTVIGSVLALLLWGAWTVGHIIANAYRVVFG